MSQYPALGKSQGGPIREHMPTAVARDSPTRTQNSKGTVTLRNECAEKGERRSGQKNILDVLRSGREGSSGKCQVHPNAQLAVLLESASWETAVKYPNWLQGSGKERECLRLLET